MDRPTHTQGRPFEEGSNHHSSNITTGVIATRPFELFTHDYEIGVGEGHTYRSLTVLAVDLGVYVPNIYATSLQPTNSRLRHKIAKLAPAAPEWHQGFVFNNAFDEYYRIEIDPDEQLETFQIFEHHLMEQLMNQPRRFDFELRGQTLYVYADTPIHSDQQKAHFAAFAATITTAIHREVRTMNVSAKTAAVASPPLLPPNSTSIIAAILANTAIYILFPAGIMTILLGLLFILSIPEKAATMQILVFVGGVITALTGALWLSRRR